MKNTTILYIEDDQDDQDFFSMAVNQLLCPPQLLMFSCGPSALHYIAKQPSLTLNYIFLDLKIAVMNGWQILHALRDIHRWQQTPIILYTDYLEYKDDSPNNECRRNLGPTSILKKFCGIDAITDYLFSILPK